MAAVSQRSHHSLMASSLDAHTAPRIAVAFPETVKVLAIRAQFQKDNDATTTGDGTFVLSASTADTTLDAPPHDAGYFRAHLLFLEHYYARVSKGKVAVTYTLLDSVVTLPSPLSRYSPGVGTSNVPVIELARDVWTAADSLHLVPDFNAYDCFVVFHAGIGHDVDLLSQLGEDPTPNDIPSLFIGPAGFQTAFGAGYQGIPVHGGAFVKNSIIMPETESRSIPGIGGDFFLELGINGLLCSSFGNFLGLPDLFNTKTGASGIGRFGLMDGQAIFSFGGAFPPEPSAWEKYWLGWIAPVEVPPGVNHSITIPAVSLADTVYRVPISSQEYFLVENRSRDPYRTGITVTSELNGVSRVQTFTRDVAGFNANSISGLAGVVTDVTVPDWSLPGETEDDGTFYDGGVLIWHIDETVIAQGLATDAVNADPSRRGVDLEEADGSQDIGQTYDLFTPGSGSEDGTAWDYWYAGNNISPVYKNEFSRVSYPDSRSNSGANSHITIRDFSGRSPHMTAIVDRGDQTIVPLAGFPKQLTQVLAGQSLAIAPLGSAPGAIIAAAAGTRVAPQQKTDSLLLPEPGKLFAWNSVGESALASGVSSGLVAQTPPNQEFTAGAAVGDLNGNGTTVIAIPSQTVGGQQSALLLYASHDVSPADGLLDLIARVPLDKPVMTVPCLGDSLVIVGDTGGRVRVISGTGAVVDSFLVNHDTAAAVIGISKLPGHGSFVAVTSDGSVFAFSRSSHGARTLSDRSMSLGHPVAGPGAVALTGNGPRIAIATTDGLLFVLDTNLVVQSGFPVNTGSTIPSSAVWADIDGDGSRDIVVASGMRVCVYNKNGVSLDGFPVTIRAERPIASSPIVGDVDGDGLADIVVVTGDGVVAAVNRHAVMLTGFPLAAGQGSQTLALFTIPGTTTGSTLRALAVASAGDGSINAWSTGAAVSPESVILPWPQYQHDAGHSGFDPTVLATGQPIASGFMPKERAYNWPNPIHGGKTMIRYYLSETAAVHVKIFTLAGDLVTEFAGPGVGGLDNEIPWDVSGVQSGIYFARIEASGSSSSAINIIKIAVVK